MQYRQLGKTGVCVSALGFGAMRLPTSGSDNLVDEDQAIAMMRYAIDHGVNYVDTAYVYHGGQGEVVVGRALADGYRSRVQLATKLPIWSVTQRDDCQRFFDEQLQRLQTDRVDFYLLHCLQRKSWQRLRELGVLEWAEGLRAEGQIAQLGFSFHDDYDAFVEIVDDYDWSFCQIQYNYVCEQVQAGTRGLEHAAGKGLGVIIMEPLFGGTLASPPPSVRKIWETRGPGYEPVDLALQWLWDKREVGCVLSGMNTLAQVQQNVASAGRARVGSLSEQEHQLIGRVREEYRQLAPVTCTKCGYCLPCPHGVNIPVNFELYNQATVLKGSSTLLCRNLYLSLAENERAAACFDCHTCEDRCPQHLAIPELLVRVRDQFQPKEQ
jgi:predicted aldo/keto reductase-like oxidoreductase